MGFNINLRRFYLLPQEFHRKNNKSNSKQNYVKIKPSKTHHTSSYLKHFFVLFFTHWKGNPVVKYDQRDLRSSLALSNKELISFTCSSSSSL